MSLSLSPHNPTNVRRLLRHGIRRSQVSLTNANLKALHNTPVQLVPPAGAGTTIVVDKVVAFLDAGSEALSGATTGIEIRFANDTWATGPKATTDLPVAWLHASADSYAEAIGVVLATTAAALVTNVGINIRANSGTVAGNASNDATAKIAVYYRITDVNAVD